MAELSVDDLNQMAKEAAYAAVGFGVLGFQRVQVHRRQLVDAASGPLSAVAGQVQGLVDQLMRLGDGRR